MKTILTTLFCLVVTITSFAQNGSESSEHMTFKGVPIDGTLNEFVLKMKESGFTHVQTENGVSMLKGDFAAYKNCYLGVVTLKQKDLVSRITVMFPECETWSSLYSNYSTLKELLTEKYGEPTEVVEEFDTSFEPKDDNDKMHEVGMNNCMYYTTYETENGKIQLTIQNDGFSSSFVLLTYFDEANTEVIRKKALDDL